MAAGLRNSQSGQNQANLRPKLTKKNNTIYNFKASRNYNLLKENDELKLVLKQAANLFARLALLLQRKGADRHRAQRDSQNHCDTKSTSKTVEPPKKTPRAYSVRQQLKRNMRSAAFQEKKNLGAGDGQSTKSADLPQCDKTVDTNMNDVTDNVPLVNFASAVRAESPQIIKISKQQNSESPITLSPAHCFASPIRESPFAKEHNAKMRAEIERDPTFANSPLCVTITETWWPLSNGGDTVTRSSPRRIAEDAPMANRGSDASWREVVGNDEPYTIMQSKRSRHAEAKKHTLHSPNSSGHQTRAATNAAAPGQMG